MASAQAVLVKPFTTTKPKLSFRPVLSRRELTYIHHVRRTAVSNIGAPPGGPGGGMGTPGGGTMPPGGGAPGVPGGTPGGELVLRISCLLTIMSSRCEQSDAFEMVSAAFQCHKDRGLLKVQILA